MKFLTTVDGQEYHVDLEGPGQITVDGTPIDADLQSIDGGFHYSLLVGAASYEVFVEHCDDVCLVSVEGHRYRVQVEDEHLRPRGAGQRPAGQEVGAAEVTSPMSGTVVAVLVQEGQAVRTGEGLLILEAMKMENEIRAPLNGIVAEVQVVPGQRVSRDDRLLRIGPPAKGETITKGHEGDRKE
jgi:biotin carboxyl carrier protein